MTHLVGQQLGRYLVQEEIGRGGMARVYRALDTMLKRTVALKVLAPQLAADPEFTQRFEREAVTAANLRHPNIVTIYDVGEHNGARFIAMEYVRGRTLHAIIEERAALGLGYAIAIIGPVAAALDYAHSQGSVHRDIKPQNIMIDVDGRVLLADFGIAQAPESGDGQRLTRTGIFMGTPEYISPEQASAQRVDGRSDLYSLGIATYEVITGAVPFSGATPQLIVAHAQTPPPPPSSIDPSQPPELDLVLARILAKRPESRFASGMAFVEGLRVVARKHGIAVATTPQVAELALPRSSSAGQSTVSLGRGQTPFAAPAPLQPSTKPKPAPLVAPELGNGDPTQLGSLPREAVPERQSTPRTRPPIADPPPRVSSPAVAPRVAGDGGSRVSGRVVPPRTAGGYGGDRDTSPRTWIVGGLLGGLFLVLLFVLWRTVNSGPPPRILVTNSPVASIVPTRVTDTPTLTPSNTPEPSATEAPTAAEIAASAVPVPPTKPPPPPPDTDTPLPPPPPSDTPVPPTDTPVPEVSPTITPTVAITPTDTPEPPTETATSPPAPTAPPTPTATTGTAVVSPSPNATAIPSPAPSATPTFTPAPTPTFTPTLTPSFTPTFTPAIVATATVTVTLTP